MSSDDFTFFVGRELLQIAVGKHQVIFYFYKDLSISMESDFEWRHEREVARWKIGKESIPQSMPWLKLIGKHVSAIQWLEDQSLKLLFDNSDELTFSKKTEGYESFQITNGARCWVF